MKNDKNDWIYDTHNDLQIGTKKNNQLMSIKQNYEKKILSSEKHKENKIM